VRGRCAAPLGCRVTRSAHRLCPRPRWSGRSWPSGRRAPRGATPALPPPGPWRRTPWTARGERSCRRRRPRSPPRSRPGRAGSVPAAWRWGSRSLTWSPRSVPGMSARAGPSRGSARRCSPPMRAGTNGRDRSISTTCVPSTGPTRPTLATPIPASADGNTARNGRQVRPPAAGWRNRPERAGPRPAS